MIFKSQGFTETTFATMIEAEHLYYIRRDKNRIKMLSKNLYIISGCNGAGKTTTSYTVLPEILDCREFVNADEIAKGLSTFNPESVAIEAGRLMLQRIEDFHNCRKYL